MNFNLLISSLSFLLKLRFIVSALLVNPPAKEIASTILFPSSNSLKTNVEGGLNSSMQGMIVKLKVKNPKNQLLQD